MKIKATHLCRCGHAAWNHTHGVFNGEECVADFRKVRNNDKNPKGCSKCYISCKKFQLPNFDLVEYLAEKRGLV